MQNHIQKHWFWKNSLGDNRLINSNLLTVNSNIFFSVKLFYCLLFIVITERLYSVNYYLEKIYADLLWPVMWTKIMPNFPWVIFFILICFFLNFLVIFNLKKRLWRILSFISFFFLFALFNSSGKINHSLHTLLIPLFCFMFIDFKKSNEYINFLIFSSSVFALLTTYSLAGFWKILRGLVHLMENENGIFSINAMARLLKYQFRYETPPAIAQWVIENEIIGFLLLWSGVFIEFSALMIFFFGKLHRVWGVLLLMLHISIAVIMEVNFAYAAITLLPMLILSPFNGNNNLSSVK